VLEEKTVRLEIVSGTERAPLDVSVARVICAGFSGRSQDDVRAHVKELAELGMPAPESTPIFFKVSSYLATTATGITVLDRLTSGEVEFVLLFHGHDVYVTCGSDHTHREVERYSFAWSKQMHPKVMAGEVWRLSDLESHWDQLILRSWSTLSGVRRLYQEGPVSQIMEPERLLKEAERSAAMRRDGTVFFSGTIPTMGGLEYGDRFEFELYDPVRDRTIRHGYDVLLLDTAPAGAVI
jgi:2-keto-4-pentenoate hydratase/2-oxohepta-3-ene-1,7-dioic acid hydratase in catechol pathway